MRKTRRKQLGKGMRVCMQAHYLCANSSACIVARINIVEQTYLIDMHFCRPFGRDTTKWSSAQEQQQKDHFFVRSQHNCLSIGRAKAYFPVRFFVCDVYVCPYKKKQISLLIGFQSLFIAIRIAKQHRIVSNIDRLGKDPPPISWVYANLEGMEVRVNDIHASDDLFQHSID